MSPDDFRLMLDVLAISQRECADIMGVRHVTARRWATGGQDIPRSVAVVLYLLSPETARIELAVARSERTRTWTADR